MSSKEDAKGPVVVWENYGYEGWHPKSYPDVKSALLDARYNSEFIISRVIDFEIVENNDSRVTGERTHTHASIMNQTN